MNGEGVGGGDYLYAGGFLEFFDGLLAVGEMVGGLPGGLLERVVLPLYSEHDSLLAGPHFDDAFDLVGAGHGEVVDGKREGCLKSISIKKWSDDVIYRL
jgi:hypothetical protein